MEVRGGCRRLVCTAVLAFLCSTSFASFRFVVTGDSRGSYNGLNLPIVSEMVPAIAAENPAFVLVPGDLISNGLETQLRAWVEAFQAPLNAAGIGVYPCRGNHDPFETDWNAVFSGPLQLPANGPASEENLTYTFTHENALFIALDQVVWTHPFGVNQAWLDETLGSNTQPHVFVFGHYPAFSVEHTSSLAFFPEQRDAFWHSLEAAGARAYFAGHDHFYDHSSIPTAQGSTIEQYVVGTAGAPLYDWAGTYPDGTVQPVSHYKAYGYLVVDVNGLDVTLTFKRRTAPGTYEASDTWAYAVPEPEPEPELPAGGAAAAAVLGIALAAAGARRCRPIAGRKGGRI
jgi:Icc protein